jgi:hypothetical protein
VHWDGRTGSLHINLFVAVLRAQSALGQQDDFGQGVMLGATPFTVGN